MKLYHKYWCMDDQKPIGHCRISGFDHPCAKCSMYQRGIGPNNYPVPAIPTQVEWYPNALFIQELKNDEWHDVKHWTCHTQIHT